ncbi:MAG: dihydropteroate synthase [Tannerellaceae bacterium]|jgi:dihydropteroate synthase|nr:dihydropteroate synthase [Tannerellaceae bacterium]
MKNKTIVVKGKILHFNQPLVMGILNITPDSFFPESRKLTESSIRARTEEILSQGALILDIGAYSSRPDAKDVSPQDEINRLTFALSIIRKHFPQAIVSIDTFRASVARHCVENFHADIINDISGGEIDPLMFETVASLHIPYVLMHMRGTPKTMQQLTSYHNVTDEVIRYLATRMHQLHLLGLSDIIIDPGFGFAKTLQQNYELLSKLSEFSIFQRPLLVGISRKSMLSKLLNIDTSQCLNGTTVLNTFALLHGADILRVHDVRQAVEAIRILEMLRSTSTYIPARS